jgi:pyruvate-formate lyase-activating enzyme
MDDLKDIGFYTLSNDRCRNASATSPLQRCELILTSRCNFKCPYCRRVGGNDMLYKDADATVRLWCEQGLKNIRFSGGEPTLWTGGMKHERPLFALAALAKHLGCEHIAVSTNGSAGRETYHELLDAGVNDFSISLDACCASSGDMMAGVKGVWKTVVENIRYLSNVTYVTVGVVLTDDNVDQVGNIIKFAHHLGVADIRIIPAAQNGDRLSEVAIEEPLLIKHPILAYRIENLQGGKLVRGLNFTDSDRCGLVVDDMAVMGAEHYPCIIYMREGGLPIGKVGPNMRAERQVWSETHDTRTDPICSKNCLDVCVEYNNRYEDYHGAGSVAAVRRFTHEQLYQIETAEKVA